MDYLRTTEPGTMPAAAQVANDLTVPRQGATDAIRSRMVALQAAKFGQDQLDRVTVSPAARGLATAMDGTDTASQERLDFLRQGVRDNTLPIFPQRVAEAILSEEGEAAGAMSFVGAAAPQRR